MISISPESIGFAIDVIGMLFAYSVLVHYKTIREMLLAMGIFISFVFLSVADLLNVVIDPNLFIFTSPWRGLIARPLLIVGLVVVYVYDYSLWRRRYSRR